MSTGLVTRRAAALAAALLVCFAAAPVSAHDPGLSSLEIRVDRDRIVATLALSAADARTAHCTDAASCIAFASESVTLLSGGTQLTPVVRYDAADGSGVAVILTFARPAGDALVVMSSVPARLPLGHRQLASVKNESGVELASRMLDARHDRIEAVIGSAPRSGVAASFFDFGLRHILGGYDHLLFLAALLLGVRRFGAIVQTVTAFTVAHSLTLGAAVLGIARAPAAIVEPLIAASIVVVGVENLIRPANESRWKLTFVFGLVHGFGFAGALRELGVAGTGRQTIAMLGSFNLGVEAGQIAVAAILWPVVQHLSIGRLERFRLVPVCSGLVIVAGTYWFVERVGLL
jgi:hydrogenase/urease accessory protein HupE